MQATTYPTPRPLQPISSLTELEAFLYCKICAALEQKPKDEAATQQWIDYIDHIEAVLDTQVKERLKIPPAQGFVIGNNFLVFLKYNPTSGGAHDDLASY